MTGPPAPRPPQTFVAGTTLQPLYVYLKNRFADTVVLTFGEIEDLVDCALPALARERADWWANAEAGGAPSAQARSWMQANRTATPNLSARTVSFARTA